MFNYIKYFPLIIIEYFKNKNFLYKEKIINYKC